MKTQTIEVEGLPEGWKAVAHRKPLKDEYILYGDEICKPKGLMNRPWLIVEKIQQRRMVFDEILNHSNIETTDLLINGVWCREVKETDIPLTNSEPNVKMCVIQGDCDDQKLELSVKELRNVRSLIKDFENLGWFINPERALLLQKITEFIKDK